MKSIGPLAILAIVVVVVLVGLGAYAYLTISKYIHTGTTQTYKVFSANQTGTLSEVMSNITSGFNTTQFQVAYAGNATVNIDGLQLSLPLTLNVSQYYNVSRAYLNVRNVPLVGNITSIQIKNGSTNYECWESINNSKKGYECSTQPASNSIFAVFDLASNASTSQNLGSAKVHFGSVNQSTVNGMPCTNLNGYFSYQNASDLNSLNLSSKVGQQVTSANAVFISCVSRQYNIPLTMSMYVVAKEGNSSTSASLVLEETAYSKSSSAAIAVLPGPIVNQTG
jgi:hypothetical protein